MILYKYLNVEGSKATIGNNCVRLRKPSEYNDAFDTEFFLSKREKRKAFNLFVNYNSFKELYELATSEGFHAIRYAYYWNILKKNVLSIAKITKRDKKYSSHLDITLFYCLGKMAIRQNDEELKKQFDSVLSNVCKQIKNNVLLSCFSTQYDSVLMWAHYAENNKGACFEFDVNPKEYSKVKYSRRMRVFQLTKLLKYYFGHEFAGEKINLDDKKYDFALKPYLTKSIDWSYENEYRCSFSDKSTDERIDYQPKITLLGTTGIRKIILGCKASKDFEDFMKKKAAEKKIPVFKIVPVEGKYKFVLVSLQ